jgi:hypothetical protein
MSFNFNYINEFDISNIKLHVESLSDEWLEDTSRQLLFKDQHGKTNSIFVSNFPLTWNGIGYPFSVNKTELYNLIKPIISDLETRLGGKVGRVLFTKLLAKSSIPQHQDNGYYLNSVHRCHIPIITNEKIMFTVGDQTINMKHGICIEINNDITHGVINDSDRDRVHLIIDIIPFDSFKIDKSQ